MPSLGLKKKENLPRTDSYTGQLPQLSNEMQLSIMNKVKNGEMSIEDALDEARKEQEHLLKEQSPTLYNFRVHKHSRYRWQQRVFQIDFKTKMLCSIEKGIVKRQLPFSMVKSCEAGTGSRFSISFKGHHDYELEAKSMEDKDKIMQLMNQIIYGNIYSGPGDDSTAENQQPEAIQSLREGVLLLHRGGLASLKWVKYQVQLHPGQLTLVPFRQRSLVDSDVTSSVPVSIVIHLSDGDTRVPKPQGFDTFTLLTHKNEYYFKVPLSNEGPGNVQKERDAWVQAIDKLCSEWKRKSRCDSMFEEKQSSRPVSIPEDPDDTGVDPESNGHPSVESVVGPPADSKTADHTSNGKDSSTAGGTSQNDPSALPKPVPKPRIPRTASQDLGFDEGKPVQSPTSPSVKIPPSPSALPPTPTALPVSPSALLFNYRKSVQSPTSPSVEIPPSPSALPPTPTVLPVSPSALSSDDRKPVQSPTSPSVKIPPSPSALPPTPSHTSLIGPPLNQGSEESGSLVVKEPPSLNIPAPPPLPFKVYSLKGKPSTKAFHWDLVGPEKIPKSFWVQGKNSKIEIDTLRLLEQFAVKVPGTIGAVEQSNTQQIMLNQKIAHNFNIFLKSFPVRPGELKDKLFIINEEDGGLSDEHITSLRRYVPTLDDVEMYKSHKGPVAELHIVDQYMMEMCNIPYLSLQLDLLLTLRELPSSMNDLQPLINQKIRLCQQLYNCRSFVSMLEYLLAIGNYLNENAGKEKAKGFRLSSLTKLSQLRGRDKNFTLLHALVEQIILHQPGLAVFTEELAEFETVPGASIKGLTAEVDVLKNELQKVVQHGKTFKKKNIAAHHPNFSKDLKAATEKYNVELNSLMKTCEEMKKLYSVILVKFGEPADQESQKLCSIISQFILDFKRTQAELV